MQRNWYGTDLWVSSSLEVTDPRSLPPVPDRVLTHIRGECVTSQQRDINCKAWSAMLELAVLVPHIPASAPSCERISLSDFRPFPGLRTCSLHCDNGDQWALLALTELWRDHCYRGMMLLFIPELSGWGVHDSQSHPVVLVSLLCTEYTYCCCHLATKHQSRGLLSWPLGRPVAHLCPPGSGGGRMAACSFEAARGTSSTTAASAVGILKPKRWGQLFLPLSCLLKNTCPFRVAWSTVLMCPWAHFR